MTQFTAMRDAESVAIFANKHMVHVLDWTLPQGVQIALDGQWMLIQGVGVVRFNWFETLDLLAVPEEAHHDLSYEAWWEAVLAKERELTGQEPPHVVWRDTVPRFKAAARQRPNDILVRLKREQRKNGDQLPDGWRAAFCQTLNGLGLTDAAKRMARMKRASNSFTQDGLDFQYYVEGKGDRSIGCLTVGRDDPSLPYKRRVCVHAVSVVDDGEDHIAVGAPYEARFAFSNADEYAVIGAYGHFGAVCEARIVQSAALKRAVDKFEKEC
jgi:hypothetical protein